KVEVPVCGIEISEGRAQLHRMGPYPGELSADAVDGPRRYRTLHRMVIGMAKVGVVCDRAELGIGRDPILREPAQRDGGAGIGDLCPAGRGLLNDRVSVRDAVAAVPLRDQGDAGDLIAGSRIDRRRLTALCCAWDQPKQAGGPKKADDARDVAE